CVLFFATQLLYFISFRSFCQELFYFAVSFFRKQLVHFIILFQECQVLFCD
ncbi:hypothetical protein EUBHAL_02406, partial [Anaerobutyricum hallii DSM 3353]